MLTSPPLAHLAPLRIAFQLSRHRRRRRRGEIVGWHCAKGLNNAGRGLAGCLVGATAHAVDRQVVGAKRHAEHLFI
jgi:hypothetical protein